MDRIATTDELFELVNFDTNSISELDIRMKDVQRGAINYYHHNTDVSMPSFTFEGATLSHTVDSLFVSTEEEQDQLSDYSFSRSSHKIVESNLDRLDEIISTDVFSDSYYNNTKIAPVIDGNELRPIQTDYYTVTTLETLLRIETTLEEQKDEEGEFSLRNSILGDKTHFLKPNRPLVGSGRGILCTKRPDGSYCLLLGKRADYVDAAAGAISSFPAGTLEEYGATDPEKTVKREFLEEFFVREPKRGHETLNDLTIEQLSSGWDARSGSMVFDYIMYSHNPVSYNNIMNHQDGNGELEELIEVPVQNIEKLSEILDVEIMSGGSIHSICYALMYMNESERFPDLDYDISVDWN